MVDDSVLGDPALAVLVVTAAVEPAEAMLPTVPVSKLLACELPVVSEAEPPDSCTASAKGVRSGAPHRTCAAGDAAGKVVAEYQKTGSGNVNGVGKAIGFVTVIGFGNVIGFGWIGTSIGPGPKPWCMWSVAGAVLTLTRSATGLLVNDPSSATIESDRVPVTVLVVENVTDSKAAAYWVGVALPLKVSTPPRSCR